MRLKVITLLKNSCKYKKYGRHTWVDEGRKSVCIVCGKIKYGTYKYSSRRYFCVR